VVVFDRSLTYFGALIIGPAIAKHAGNLEPVLSVDLDRSGEGDILGGRPSTCDG